MSTPHPHRHPRPAWGAGARSFARSPQGRALTAAALTLPGVWRAPRAVRVAWVLLPSLLVAGRVASTMQAREDPPSARAAVATACAGACVSAGAVATGLLVDARLERALRRGGAPWPRLVVALVNGVLSATMSHLAGRRLDARRAAPGQGSPTDPRPRSDAPV